MTTVVKRDGRTFADMFDWLEAELPGLPIFRPFTATQLMRVEEFRDEGGYTLRLEVPGVDPDKDITITVEGGSLTVTAVRQEQKHEATRSEFRYGTLTRSVSLPVGADPDDVTATYGEGILEVRVGVRPEAAAEARQIPIARS